MVRTEEFHEGRNVTHTRRKNWNHPPSRSVANIPKHGRCSMHAKSLRCRETCPTTGSRVSWGVTRGGRREKMGERKGSRDFHIVKRAR